MLKGGAYGGAGTATITLKNLVVGDAYQVQVWVNDNRATTRTEKADNNITLKYNSTGAAGGVGQYVIGTFTADAVTQAFTLVASGTGAAAQLNAIQVRDTGARNGTWNTAASGGLWSTAGNWTGNVIANGAGSTADFSQVNIATDPLIVHLDSARMIGNLIFGDTDPSSAASWTLDNNDVSTNTLTLYGSAPILAVNTLGSGKSATISAVIAGNSGLTKTGAGTLTLAAINTESGTVTVDNGTLVYGTDQITALAGLAFGATAGSTNYGSLDLSGASLTAGSLAVQNNNATANAITIGSGKTLTITGAASLYDSVSGSVLGMNMTGTNGTFTVNSAGSDFVVGRNIGASSSRTVTLDMHNLGTLNATVNNFQVGYYPANVVGNYDAIGMATTYLASASTITASVFGVGAKGSHGTGVVPGSCAAMLYLGGGANAINADAIYVGENQDSGIAGQILWNSGVTGGSLSLHAKDGSSAVGNMYVGAKTDTGSTSTHSGVVDLSNGQVTGAIGNLYVGYQTQSGGSNSPKTYGTFKMGAGTGSASALSVTSLYIGYATAAADSNHTCNGTVELDGGALTAGTVELAHMAYCAGTLNLLGGTLTVNGNISVIGGTGASSTLTLNGGTLDLTNHNLGSASPVIGTLNFQSGTLENVAAINGTAGLAKTGGGTLILAGVNSYSGGTTVNGGTLQLGADNALPGATIAGDVSVSGTLDLNTHNNSINGLNGAGTVDTVAGGTPVLTVGANGNSGSFSGIIQNTAGTLSLTKSGAGTQTLSGLNTYQGATTINGGMLVVSSLNSSSGIGGVSMSPGASLRVVVSAGNQWVPPFLTLGSGSSGTTLEFDGISSTSQAPLAPGSVIAFGVTTVNINSGTGLTPGSGYPLLANAGSLSSYNLGAQPIGVSGSLVIDGGGTLVYVITPQYDIWAAAAGGAWDTATSANWSGHAVNNIPFGTYVDGDLVLFDDTAGPGSNVVTISGALNPAAVVVNNSGTAYAITGSAGNDIGGGASITKSGNGILTLDGPHTYSGGTTLAAGQLNIDYGASADATHSAIGTGPLTIGNGAIIDNTGGGDVTLGTNNAQNWNGSFTFLGSLHNLDLGSGAVTLNATPVVTVSQNHLTVRGGVSGSHGLTKDGGGTLVLTGAISYAGLTTINGGTLTLEGDNTAAVGGITLNGGTLNANSTTALGTGIVSLAGGTLDNTSGSAEDLTTGNAVTLGGFSFSTSSGTAANNLDLGTGPVTNAGNQTITLNGTNTTLTLGGIMTNTSNAVQTTTVNGAGNTLVLGGYALSDNATSRVDVINGTGNMLITGSVTNGGTATASGLKYSGAGILTLAGNNTFAGGISVSSGTLVLSGSNTGAVTISGGGRLDITGGTAIGDSSAITLSGSGSMFDVQQSETIGSLTVASGNTNSIVQLANGTVLTLNGAGDFYGKFIGQGGLRYSGAANATWFIYSPAGNNTYSGDTTITSGRVSPMVAGAMSSHTSIVVTGTAAGGGQFFPQTADTIPNNLVISGVGYSDQSGAIRFGAIRLVNNIRLTGTITLADDARIGLYGGAPASIEGRITGAHSIDYYAANSGNSQLNTFTLSDTGTASDYTGNTSITNLDYTTARTGCATVVKLGASEQIPNGIGSGNLVFNGTDANHLAILELNGYNETLNGLSAAVAAGAVIRNTTTGTSILQVGDADTTSTFAGIITDGGTGSGKSLVLTKIGGGMLTLLGANTHTGGTTISSGILALGDGTTTGSVAGDITDNAVLVFDPGASNLTYAGVIGGSGSVTKDGPNIVTLAASNNYFGVTTIAAGTLALGNGIATGSVAGDIVNDATLVLDPGVSNLTYAGVISGSGSVTKVGPNSVTLAGSNTHTGASTVNAGKLFVNGDQSGASGSLTVSANATLGGTGIIGGDTTIADAGKLEFTISTAASSHHKLALAAGKSMTFSGASILTLTTTGSVVPGDYTLVTAPGGFGASVAPGTVNLPDGWTAEAPRFVGSALMIHITATGSGYANWQTLNGTTQDLNGDHDGDGVPNGIEYFLGGPNAKTTGFTPLPGVSNDSGTLSVTWPKGTGYTGTYGTDFWVETSADLTGVWTAETIDSGTISDTATYVRYTFPEPLGAKKFVRLKVTGP